MARPPGYCLPSEGGSAESPAELRAELGMAIADRDRARAQRDFLQRSLEQLRAALARPCGADALLPMVMPAVPEADELRAQRDEARREVEFLRNRLAEASTQLAQLAKDRDAEHARAEGQTGACAQAERQLVELSAQRSATCEILDNLRLQVAALEEVNRPRHDCGPSPSAEPDCPRVVLKQPIAARAPPDGDTSSTVDPPKLRPTLARRNWRTTALVAGAGLTLTSVWMAVTRQPEWYHPRPIDRTRLHADKAALAGLFDNISAALNADHEIRFRLDEEQLNRWLAARAEMFPDAMMDLGTLEDPQVSLVNGEIRIGATATAGRVRAVLALACRVELQKERVTVLYKGLRLGVVPLPASWLPDPVNALSADGRSAIQVRAPGLVALSNDWVWPNGKRHCRLRELRVVDGAAEVVVEPLR